MSEKQPSAEAVKAAVVAVDRYTTDYRLRHDIALALDAFAARSRREAITECADVCRSLGQYSGRNVQPAIEQIADQIAALNSGIEGEKTILRKYFPWDLPAERLEAMARAMYECGPMFKNTGLAWNTFPDYLADRRAVYIADALTAYHADPLLRELYPKQFDDAPKRNITVASTGYDPAVGRAVRDPTLE